MENLPTIWSAVDPAPQQPPPVRNTTPMVAQKNIAVASNIDTSLEIYGSPKAITEFHLFGKLPTELRLHIWGLASPPSNIFYGTFDLPSTRDLRPRIRPTNTALLQACTEARNELVTSERIKRWHPTYQSCFDLLHKPVKVGRRYPNQAEPSYLRPCLPPCYISLSYDIVYVRRLEINNLEDPITAHVIDVLSKVPYLIMNGYPSRTEAFRKVLSAVSFKHTKKLFIMTFTHNDSRLNRARDEAHLRRAERVNGKKISAEYIFPSDIEDMSILDLHDGIRPGRGRVDFGTRN
ncbi:hypothetical protein GLAREA_03513 [Glarea lozoyensis ATCC 20868]|uniref:2EXR domain-containing protein n=1 Tax=Glarea lozoyensis (strain ATCC 20868 / MF5171) TaxID=1116229 RepID=S3DEY0_GLAL2|nr:uncharacterized protein GLAREA_03513 [Glarea lozoyensis ATCC 20868]EPE30546.1 hypothetical protein GLAREA_03513 [Glarea lozoyensis ATCC 20868]